MPKSKSIIIGAGVSGLAAAIRLAVAGHEVHVYEANAYPGGKIYQFEKGGYRFDGGPSLFTQPDYIDELFELAGKEVNEYFSYSEMDESCRYFWEDGSRIIAHADLEKFEKEIQSKLNIDKGYLKNYLDKSNWKYDKVGHIFLEKSLHEWSTWFSKDVLKALPHSLKYDLFSSLHKVNESQFPHPKLVQIFDRYATYNGSDPFRTSGMMSIIPHFEHNQGVYLPKNGMFDIPKALYQLGKDLGVQFHFNTKVDRIIIRGKEAKGIITNDQEISAHNVISAIDIVPTYKELLKGYELPSKIESQERSTSAIVFYWGIKKEFPELDLHNILFSDNYKEEFNALREGEMSADPTVYINITSKYVKDDAPDGCENWFVMINAPYDEGQDWEAMTQNCRKNSIGKINRILNTDIEQFIEVEKSWTPPEIASQTGSFKGALYGSSSNTLFSAFNRHPNFKAEVSDLYFCGGSVHPGGGIPLCLLSAKISTNVLLKHL